MDRKTRKEYDFFILYRRFVNDTRSGKRLQKNGKRIRKSTLKVYEMMEHYLQKYCRKKNITLRIIPGTRLGNREFKREKKYWKDFYDDFTSYLYYEENGYDNFVCRFIKQLRVFFNYLNDEKGMSTAPYCKKFYSHQEEISIVVLTPERLNFLIYDKAFEDSLRPVLKKAKDIFAFGCTVGLRISDLMTLTRDNIEVINDRTYLCVQSKKTHTFTRIKLPQYAIDIIEKDMRRKTLMPYMHNVYLNKYIKRVAEQAGWTEIVKKERMKRGIPNIIYKDPKKKTHFRFCDTITSHTMRRTAITTMLLMGMKENLVRMISGHAPGSKEFYRYVTYAQSYMDEEMDNMHSKLVERRLKAA